MIEPAMMKNGIARSENEEVLVTNFWKIRSTGEVESRNVK
jgi:hypothetical protein